MFWYDYNLKTKVGNQTMNLAEMHKGGIALQFFACWIEIERKMVPLQQCLDLIDCYYKTLECYPDDFVPFSKDFDPACGKIATVLTIEGGEALMGQLSNLRLFKRLGVRAMTLTWNNQNELAYPSMSRKNRGLTERGIEVIKEMNRIGMAIDLSHLSDAGIDDVLMLSTAPVFASHSNARAVFDHKRSLCDEHIKAIAKSGGVIGVNFYEKQLTSAPTCSSADIVRHIEHIASITDVSHVCFGSDFDGMPRNPTDIPNCAAYQTLVEALLHLNYSEEDVLRIAYGNLRDYIAQFC